MNASPLPALPPANGNAVVSIARRAAAILTAEGINWHDAYHAAYWPHRLAPALASDAAALAAAWERAWLAALPEICPPRAGLEGAP